MDFHPSQLPIAKNFEIKDVKEANDAVEEMIKMGFTDRKDGFKVLMPKEKSLARRIGYTVTTGLSYGLRKIGQERNVRYWTYHHDENHYAIVLISSKALESLGY